MGVQQQGTVSFRELLRQHRTVAGLSQEALAEQAGLSTRAVSDLERGVKTRPHPATMRTLADALELGADDRAALAAASRPGRETPSTLSDDLPHSVSPIVGRTRELDSGIGLLHAGTARLLTVTGPGGVGKTRLALEIARAVAVSFPDSSVFVELGPVAKASLVIPTVGTALKLRQTGGQPPLDTIRTHLRSRRVLLVLDNCEHLLGATRQLVADLLAVAPDLRILATSRSPLRVRGEHLLPLDPLPMPDRDMSVEEMSRVPAIALFVQRAQAIRPDFQLTEANAPDVATICTQLDGLPLAIELAAIQLRALSLQALAGVLDQRLRLLSTGPEDAPARHRTLRAAIAWSYDLLALEHQVVFRALGAFAGDCTLESVAEVAAGGDPFTALDGVEALVDQGLLRRVEHPDGELRFGMLETVREYAVERLNESGEDTAVRSRLAHTLLVLAEQIAPRLHGPQPGLWLDRLEREQDNFRVALAWSLGPAGDPSTALRLAVALWPFWHMRGHFQEGRAWLERTIAQGKRVDPAVHAAALLTLANIANNLEDHHQAESLYGESLRLFEEIGDVRRSASALIGLGMVATTLGDYPRAEHLLREALAMEAASVDTARLAGLYALGRLDVARGRYREARRVFADACDLCEPDDIGVRAYLSLELAQIERLEGNLEVATRLAEGCLVQFREMGERRAEAATLAELGHVALLAGDTYRAGDLFPDAAAVPREVRGELGLVVCLEGYATLAARIGRPKTAALLGGAADAWRTRTGTRRTVAEQQAFDQVVAAVRVAMGEPPFAATWEAGGQLEPEQAWATVGELVTS